MEKNIICGDSDGLFNAGSITSGYVDQKALIIASVESIRQSGKTVRSLSKICITGMAQGRY
jgi:hypothetical protein